MNLILDGELILNRETLHDILSSKLTLPEWYGRNLDALYDCLTDLRTETVISLRNRAAFEKNLGHYGTRFLRLLEDASRENPCLVLKDETTGD